MLLSPVVVLVLAVLVPGFIEAVKVDRCELRNQLRNLTSTDSGHEQRKDKALATVICELENLNLSLTLNANSIGVVRVKRGAHGQNKGLSKKENGHSTTKDNSVEDSSVEDSSEGKNQSLSHSNSTGAGRVKRGASGPFNGPFKGGHSQGDSSEEDSSERDSSEETGAMTNMTLADCVAVDNDNVTVNATCIKLVSRKVCKTASAKCKSVSPNDFFLNCPNFVPLLPPTPPHQAPKKDNDKRSTKRGRH